MQRSGIVSFTTCLDEDWRMMMSGDDSKAKEAAAAAQAIADNLNARVHCVQVDT